VDGSAERPGGKIGDLPPPADPPQQQDGESEPATEPRDEGDAAALDRSPSIPPGGLVSGRSPTLPAAETLARPSLSQPEDVERNRAKNASQSRVRTALAIGGGAALFGAAVLSLAMSASRHAPVARAHGALLGGSFSPEPPVEPENDGGSVVEAAAAAQPPVWRVAQLAEEANVILVQRGVGHHTLLGALEAAGLMPREAERVVRSLAKVRDVDRISPKDSVAVARDRETGRAIAFEIATSPTDIWQAREDMASDPPTLLTRKLDVVPEQVRMSRAVVVGGDLRASFAEAGLAPIDEMLALLDDALDGHAELSDIRPGARLRIVATQERVAGEAIRWSSLDAVEYFPAASNAPSVRVYRFDVPSQASGASSGDDSSHARRHRGWFDAKGRQPYRGGFRSPVPLARVASRFNPHRMHPVLHVVMPHNGVDFAAPMGAPVYATAAGVVTSVGPDGPCGNKVEIAHPDGYASVYCHLSRFAAGVRPGQHVESRQLIAYVGQTGRVTGPHLHFGIRRGGVFIDPLTLRLDGVRVVPRAHRDDFDRVRLQLDAEIDTIPLPAASPPSEISRANESDETFYEEP
jgi:murein DD-endopeptidase MepM/ murein hydrolase activator NlpD